MLGIRLRISREKSGYSRRDLSELSGIDQTTIYKIETDKILNPKITTIEKLANALEINVFYLLGATDDPARKQLKTKQVTIHKPLPLDQVKKTLETFEEIKFKQTIHKSKQGRQRPYYPLFVDIPVDAGAVQLDHLPPASLAGHLNIEFNERVDYILRVKGDLMSPVIEDGALIYVQRYETGLLKDEDIGIFYLIEKNITVARQIFYHKIEEKLYAGLRSLNPKTTEWYLLSPDFITSQGKVVGCENNPDEVTKMIDRIEKIK